MTWPEAAPRKRQTIATIALIALLVTTVAAGGPRNAPENPVVNEANETATDEAPSENASENASTADYQSVGPEENASTAMDWSDEPNETASAAVRDASAANAQGPPANLPHHVPAHVKRIHYPIRDFLDGELNSPLGEAIEHL